MDNKNIFSAHNKSVLEIVSVILSEGLNVEKQLQLLVDKVRFFFNTDICFLGLLSSGENSKNAEFDIVSVSCEDKNEAKRIEKAIKKGKLYIGIRDGKTEGVTAWCIEHKKHFCGGNIQNSETKEELEKLGIVFKDPKYKSNPVESELCVPFYSSDINETIKGALDIEDTEINKFNEKKHKHMLDLFAHIALMILANSKSLINFLHIIKKINLSSYITEPILSSFLKTVGADYGFICSRNPITKIIDVKTITTENLYKNVMKKYRDGTFEENDFGLNLKAFKGMAQYGSDVEDLKRKKEFINFWPNIKSNAAIPMKYEGEVIGTFDLEYVNRKTFSNMDQEILESLAGLPEVALIKSNLLKDLEGLYARSPWESKIRREERITEILKHCQDIMKSEECLLVFYDDNRIAIREYGDRRIKYNSIKQNIAPTDIEKFKIVHMKGKDYLCLKTKENTFELFFGLKNKNQIQSVYLFINKNMDDLLHIREFELHEENIERTKDCFYQHGIIVGENPQMQYVLRQVTAAVRSKNTIVFIEGESGTGKELIADVIHALSKGKKAYNTYAAINCAALPEQLLESEIFGTVKGAFTHAVTRRGFFETIKKGSILLDEITEMSIASQAKLLRALQTREFYRLGSTKKIKIKDTRIIASTNKNLLEEVAKGKFRSDLYYRLNTIKIHVPSLRERREHIFELSKYFMEKCSREFKKPQKEFSEEAVRYLNSYSWPGNIRELENSIIRAVINEVGPIIHVNYLLPEAASSNSTDEEKAKKSAKLLEYPLMVGLKEDEIIKFKYNEIKKINSMCWFIDQNIAPTPKNIGKHLNMSKATFYNNIDKYKLPKPQQWHKL